MPQDVAVILLEEIRDFRKEVNGKFETLQSELTDIHKEGCPRGKSNTRRLDNLAAKTWAAVIIVPSIVSGAALTIWRVLRDGS